MGIQIPITRITKHNIHHLILLEAIKILYDIIMLERTVNTHFPLYAMDFLHAVHVLQVHLADKEKATVRIVVKPIKSISITILMAYFI